MRKIIIIGPAGAGKTTLAIDLARRLDVPHVELDSINHQENWTSIDGKEFKRIANEKTSGDGWIVCGNYFSTLGIDFWKKSDAVVWLDYPFPLVINRLLRRTVKRTLTKQELWNGNKESFISNFFTADSVIFWMMKSWAKKRRKYESIFAHGDDLPNVKLIRLKTPAQTKLFLKHI